MPGEIYFIQNGGASFHISSELGSGKSALSGLQAR